MSNFNVGLMDEKNSMMHHACQHHNKIHFLSKYRNTGNRLSDYYKITVQVVYNPRYLSPTLCAFKVKS
jgi:hypothetical protein